MASGSLGHSSPDLIQQPLLIKDSPCFSPPPITSVPNDHTRAHSTPVICSFFSTSTAPRVCLPRLVLGEGANPSLFYRLQCTEAVMKGRQDPEQRSELS